ncbi:ABC transporter permease [Alphaproteobacteria bacterium]|jgi:putrescine transport system permease protein|nr:ABC transporter permease [Alphaproteobacteria bacterium]
MSRFSPFNAVALTFGFAFLYLPIMLLVVYSFNENDLVTVWTGFSFKWYGEMFANRGFRDAAWVTIRVALISSTVATVLGMMAAVTLVRAKVFFGRTLFTGMVYTPLVMPEVITGISLLLFFVNFDINRGMETLIIAHITFTMAFATVVISSRLIDFDMSLEEAARDLGCSRFEAFMRVTLPNIAPAVAAAWFLSLALSLDDVVVSQFVNGPGSTTLPIKVLSSVRLGVSPEINALSATLIGLVTSAVIIATIIQKTRAVRES